MILVFSTPDVNMKLVVFFVTIHYLRLLRDDTYDNVIKVYRPEEQERREVTPDRIPDPFL